MHAHLLSTLADKIRHARFIYCDTETTGLINNEQIIQIAAFDERTSFNKYSVPTRPKLKQDLL